MSTDATPTDGRPLSGILIPEQLEVWTAETTLDEQEARPGRLLPDRPTRLRLIATGEPVTGEAWEVLASVGGVPGGGRNDDAGSARFLQRPTTDPVSAWRGLDPPTSVSHVAIAGTPTFWGVSPTIVQTASGREVCVYEDQEIGAINTKTIRARYREPAGAWTGSITIATFVGLGSAVPCLVQTESGRLDVYLLDSIDSTRRVVRYSSDDEGATWELSASSCLRLETVADATATRLRIAAGGGQVLMLVGYDASVAVRARQYASSDDGSTFALVGTYSDAWPLAVAYDSGRLHCLWQAKRAAGGVTMGYIGLGSAFTAQDPATATTIASETGAEQTPIPEQGGGIWTDAAGVIYACWQVTDNTGTIHRNAPIWMSTNGGIEWASAGPLFAESTTSAAGWYYDLCVRRSRSGALACWASTIEGDGVYVAQLGGWSTATMPGLVDQPASPAKISTWERGWIATEGVGLEDGGTWAETLTGAPTKVLGALAWNISGTSAMDATYVRDLGANSVHGHVRIAIDPTGGAGTTYITLTVAQDSGPDRTYEIRAEIYYALGTYQIIDVATSAVLLAATTIPASAFELWLGIGRKAFSSATGAFGAFARRRLLSGDPEDRAWTVLVDSATLTVATATNPNTSKVTIETNPGASAAWDLTLLWAFTDLAGVTGAGLGLADGTERLFGAPFTPRSQYVRDGLSLSASGLVRRLDSWTHSASYAYGIEQALPTVLSDPRRGHKATTADDGFYAFTLPGGDAPRGGLWGIYVDGVTWDQVAIAVRTGAAWVTLGTVDLGEAVTYTSDEDVTYANEAPDSPRYYAENELAGCWIEDGSTIYEIQSNTEGAWSTAGQRVELRVDPDAGAASGHIRFRRGLILIYLASGATFEAIRLGPEKIYGAVLESAIIAIGRVRVLGDGWDATESRVRELGEVLAETSTGGAATSRPRADRRVVELAHSREIAVGDPGRYVRALTGGPAVGTAGDPHVLDGIVGAAGRSPVVLIPSIPVLGGSTTRLLTIGGPSDVLYGRFVPETYRQDVVRTDQHGRSSRRGSTYTIVEEVG